MAIQLRGVVNAYLDANHNQLTLCDAVTNVDVIFGTNVYTFKRFFNDLH